MTGADGQDGSRRRAGAGSDGVGAGLAGAGLPQGGLSWSWEVDLEALVAPISDSLAWGSGPGASPGQAGVDAAPAPVDAGQAAVAGQVPAGLVCDDHDAELAEYLEARRAGRG